MMTIVSAKSGGTADYLKPGQVFLNFRCPLNNTPLPVVFRGECDCEWADYLGYLCVKRDEQGTVGMIYCPLFFYL
jgi:hypothetical protein